MNILIWCRRAPLTNELMKPIELEALNNGTTARYRIFLIFIAIVYDGKVFGNNIRHKMELVDEMTKHLHHLSLNCVFASC